MKPAPVALSSALLFLLVAAAISATSAIQWPFMLPYRPSTPCVSEMVAMYACLPCLNARPRGNAKTLAPSSACCSNFFSVLGGGAACFCRLVRKPLLRGLPLNSSRLLSLFSSCGGSIPASSFMDVCRGDALPSSRNSSWRTTGFEPSSPPAILVGTVPVQADDGPNLPFFVLA